MLLCFCTSVLALEAGHKLEIKWGFWGAVKHSNNDINISFLYTSLHLHITFVIETMPQRKVTKSGGSGKHA